MERDEERKPFYTNYMTLSIISYLLFPCLIYYLYNLQAVMFFVASCVICIFFLETINYLEHYGLRRKKLANGEYEKVTIRHSWNAPHRFSNYLLFKLQRHSDHH